MSLFPSVDAHIATITQPDINKPVENQTFIGKRILKSASRCDFLSCGRYKTMVRYCKWPRRRQVFWLTIVCFLSCFIYLTYFIIYIPQISSRKLEENSIVNTEVIVKRSEEIEIVNDVLPDLPAYPVDRRLQKPFLLHYLWCGQRVFEFRHFLAIKSALHVLKPDKILFHYVDLPLTDREGYFVWFNETLKQIPDVIPNKLDRSSCPSIGSNRLYLVLQILSQHGGLYLPDDVIMLDFPFHIRQIPFASNVLSLGSDHFQDGIISVNEANFALHENSRELDVQLANNRKISTCVDLDAFEKLSSQKIICLNVNKMIFPRDIWNSNSKFALVSRVITYSTLNIRAENYQTDPIPKIAHYICTDECEINFIKFISVLSCVFVARLDRVYIHGSIEPNSRWWTMLQEYPVIFVQHSDDVFGLPSVQNPLRLEILGKFGGIFLDWDVLWTQQIPEHYFGYETVISPDWHLHGSWPDSVNPSVLMSKPQSNYLNQLRDLFITGDKPTWFINHYEAYHILEVDPQSAFLDRHLQVKCLNHLCHPTWLRDYRSELNENKPGGSFNWRNETLSIQWVDNNFLDLDSVKYLSGIPVEIAKFVLKAANINLMDL